MWKKIAVAGAAGACVLGAGTAALAATGGHNAQSAKTTAATTTTHHHRHIKGMEMVRDTVHAQWVTKSSTGYVTHDAIRGDVTAVSSTSITVKASDGVSGTFAVKTDTKVHTRTNKKTAVIGDVKSGDAVLVVGTGTGTSMVATQVVDTAK